MAVVPLRARFDTLTPCERQVTALVVAGRVNKQIAGDLGGSEIAAKVPRGLVMRKMQAWSLPGLARIADRLKLTPAKGPRASGGRDGALPSQKGSPALSIQHAGRSFGIHGHGGADTLSGGALLGFTALPIPAIPERTELLGDLHR